MQSSKQRDDEDQKLLDLILNHPEKFEPYDQTYRAWTIKELGFFYSALRLGRIIDKASEAVSDKKESCLLARKIYAGLNNFEQESVFDHGECEYTAIHKDSRQGLFVLKRINTAKGEQNQNKHRNVLLRNEETCFC